VPKIENHVHRYAADARASPVILFQYFLHRSKKPSQQRGAIVGQASCLSPSFFRKRWSSCFSMCAGWNSLKAELQQSSVDNPPPLDDYQTTTRRSGEL
jgi:hypothetical protein